MRVAVGLKLVMIGEEAPAYQVFIKYTLYLSSLGSRTSKCEHYIGP
jgi:hypothetical protein